MPMPENIDTRHILQVVLEELIESVEDHVGSRTVVVDGEELTYKYRNGICTINDDEGEPYVRFKIKLEIL